MKWPWQKEGCEHHLCQCDGLVLRQTTLEEFGFEFLLSSQTRLDLRMDGVDVDHIPKPVRYTTGLQNWRSD